MKVPINFHIRFDFDAQHTALGAGSSYKCKGPNKLRVSFGYSLDKLFCFCCPYTDCSDLILFVCRSIDVSYDWFYMRKPASGCTAGQNSSAGFTNFYDKYKPVFKELSSL